MTAVFAIKST